MNDRKQYKGMTINERLFDAGLVQAFDTAATDRDRAEMIRLLNIVEVVDAASTAAAILKSPERYGY